MVRNSIVCGTCIRGSLTPTRLREAGVPYVSVCTDPTTGGVAAVMVAAGLALPIVIGAGALAWSACTLVARRRSRPEPIDAFALPKEWREFVVNAQDPLWHVQFLRLQFSGIYFGPADNQASRLPRKPRDWSNAKSDSTSA